MSRQLVLGTPLGGLAPVRPSWVSKERFVWHEEVRTVLPYDSVGGGACFFDGGSRCADGDYYKPP